MRVAVKSGSLPVQWLCFRLQLEQVTFTLLQSKTDSQSLNILY